jgi:transcriptional regulator with XRE-family HTH domain
VNVAEQIGANVRYCRKRAGLSQEELSFRSGLHRTAVSQIERSLRVSRADTIVRLAGALGVDPGDLLNGIVWEPGEMRPGRFELPDSDATL